jgi:uncharacterized LabA/DUF88 family protein
MMNKVAVFIDGGYLSAINKDLGIHQLAYAKLIDKIVNPDELFGTYYYNATDKPNWRANPFFYGLSFELPKVDIRMGRLTTNVIRGVEVIRQKRVDTRLVQDMTIITLYKKVDKIILIGGDEDLVPGLELASQEGITTEVWYGNTNTTKASEALLNWSARSQVLSREWLEANQLIK